jgi:Kef-type K+ transport system membrane component KefB
VVFFLLTAGLEIDLRSIFRQGKSALLVSLFGVAFPLGAGFLAASIFLNISVRKKERIRSSSRC